MIKEVELTLDGINMKTEIELDLEEEFFIGKDDEAIDKIIREAVEAYVKENLEIDIL